MRGDRGDLDRLRGVEPRVAGGEVAVTEVTGCDGAANGGIRCAASPAGSTRPERHSVAKRAWKVHTTCRSSVALPGSSAKSDRQLARLTAAQRSGGRSRRLRTPSLR
ncbi:hypothetical protein GCM10025792_16570 [Pseudonocardia tropica]